MSETETAPPHSVAAAVSFSLWPPAQRTRDAVVDRLIATLSAPSVLSNRYGTLSSDEASVAARHIEDEAFSSAAAASADGIETLQLYSKEISKRMLDTFKARAPPCPAAVEGVAAAVSDEL